jgi:N utilization substance protein B
VRAYTIELVNGVTEHEQRIDELLSTYSTGWSVERMPGVDRAALRLAVWEMLYSADTPDAVAIDEAVTTVAELSTDESPNFVSGLLNRIKDLKPALID